MVGVKNATRAAMAWYVSYRTGGTTVLRNRELAIDAACRFLIGGTMTLFKSVRCLGPATERYWIRRIFDGSKRAGRRGQQRWRS